MDKLIEDWVEVELGEVCEKAEKVRRNEISLNSNFRYFDIGGIDNITNRIVGFKEYSWEEAPSRAQQIIKKGDVLFSTVRTYLKNIAQVDKEEYNNEICSSGFTVLRGNKIFLDSAFLFHYSLSLGFLNPLSKLQTGTSYPAVRDKDVFSQIISLPPLPIQRAIVLKIENLFASLDKGIADLEKAQQQLKVYRQAVLKKAFEGDYSKKDFELKRIDSICEVVRGGSPRPAGSPIFYDGPIPFMKVKDLSRNSGVYVDSAEHSIKEAGLKKTRLVDANTLLLTNSGATLGIPAITKIKTTFNDGIAAFLGLDKDDLLFHYYYWCSKTVYLRNLNQGAAQPNLNTDIIGAMIIPVYRDKTENIKIVREIESRLSVCDKVEQSITESLEKAKALRQSILKKAFEGKLLSEAEIAQCKKEKDYEPASVLLEKVRTGLKKIK